MLRRSRVRHATTRVAALAALIGTLTACSGGDDKLDTLNIDYATYNPLSLVIKDQGWLEDALSDDGIDVEWVHSAGSNKANESLRSGAIQVGSTAGSAALLARANGSPIRIIDIYTRPEWTGVTVPEGSDITTVADLKGKKVAATKGTDAYFFLVQSLEEAGLTVDDVTVENLQHPDGWAALQNGSVDAWAGLDPIMATAEKAGAQVIYRNVEFNTYGTLDATEDFVEDHPDVAQVVVDAYAKAREWALANPDELADLYAEAAGVDRDVAEVVLAERTGIDVDNVPGEAQVKVLEVVGPLLVDTGDVPDQALIDDALDGLIEPEFAEKADASRID